MTNSNLLGIYIPTYNREKELEECLRAFIPQLKAYGFPIYVSDNCSTDNTEGLIRNIDKEYENIHYKKSGKNLGYSLNFVNVLRMGNTHYAWIVADDDVIYPDTINLIVKNLEEGYDFLQINAEVYSQNLKNKIKNRILPYTEDIVYEVGEHERALLAHKHTDYQGFNPHMIIRKELLDREIRRINPKAPNMDFIHTVVFYRGIVGQKGKLIARPLIKARGGNWGYSKRIMEIFFKSWYITHSMLEQNYSEEVLNEVKARSFLSLCIPIAVDRVINNSNPSQIYKKYIKENKNISQSKKEVLKLIVFTPRPVLKLVYESYKKIMNY